MFFSALVLLSLCFVLFVILFHLLICLCAFVTLNKKKDYLNPLLQLLSKLALIQTLMICQAKLTFEYMVTMSQSVSHHQLTFLQWPKKLTLLQGAL